MSEKIAVIGAGGKMGKWICNYLSKKKIDVVGYDSENPLPKSLYFLPSVKKDTI